MGIPEHNFLNHHSPPKMSILPLCPQRSLHHEQQTGSQIPFQHMEQQHNLTIHPRGDTSHGGKHPRGCLPKGTKVHGLHVGRTIGNQSHRRSNEPHFQHLCPRSHHRKHPCLVKHQDPSCRTQIPSVATTRLESGPQARAGRFCKSADRANLSHQLALSRDCKLTQTAHPLASTASEFPLPACVLSMLRSWAYAGCIFHFPPAY